MRNEMTSSRRPRLARLGVAGAAGILLASALSGCAQIGATLNPQAWAITYHVEVEGEGSDLLSEVTYGEAKQRGGDTESTELGEVTTTEKGNDEGVREWQAEAVVTATRPAWVEVTPGPDASVRCRILIDGVREIHSTQSQPGETLTCEVDTPEFTG